jgi:hypothetical protein
MALTARADDHVHKDYGCCLRRARVAGYVLLAGLFLEAINGMIWFHGIESLASVISILLMAGGVSGEIFFESRASLADKNTRDVAAPHTSRGRQPELDLALSGRGFNRRGVALQFRSRRTPSQLRYVAAEQF